MRLEDLPKKYQDQILQKQNKYHNEKVCGYDSRKEYNRAYELHALEKAGKIQNLREQVSFQLIPAQDGEHRHERPLKYIADFVYMENGQEIVEDCKGKRTPEYIIKRKIMLEKYGISIKEV